MVVFSTHFAMGLSQFSSAFCEGHGSHTGGGMTRQSQQPSPPPRPPCPNFTLRTAVLRKKGLCLSPKLAIPCRDWPNPKATLMGARRAVPRESRTIGSPCSRRKTSSQEQLTFLTNVSIWYHQMIMQLKKRMWYVPIPPFLTTQFNPYGFSIRRNTSSSCK